MLEGLERWNKEGHDLGLVMVISTYPGMCGTLADFSFCFSALKIHNRFCILAGNCLFDDMKIVSYVLRRRREEPAKQKICFLAF